MLARLPTCLLILALAAFAVSSCSESTSPGPSPFDEIVETFQLGPLPEIPYPPYNPYNPARIELGRLLFFDPILGGESAPWVKAGHGKDPAAFRANDMACGTCHHPDFGFADGRRLGSGVGGAGIGGTDLGPARLTQGTSIVTGQAVGVEPRNSMTVLNTAFNGIGSIQPVPESFQFMDGRVILGLEVQAQEPIVDREEMAGDAYGRDVLGGALTQDAVRDSIVLRLRAIPEYVQRFQQAFPGEIQGASDLKLNYVTAALAAYERELITPGSRYDRFISGDVNVFSREEKEGFLLFFGKALCGDCHRGPMLSDYDFHVQGVADDYDSFLPGFPGKDGMGRDLGRYHADPEEFADRKFAFRTLTIRNVELTAPYFHSGSAATLEDVVAFYDRGGEGPGDISDADLAAEGAVRDSSIRPLGLSALERRALVAFMKTTTAPVQPGPPGVDLDRVPESVPSGLVPPGIPSP